MATLPAASYTLPDQAESRKKELSDYSILIFGEKKIGKTTFCREFPDPFFLFTEPGEGDMHVKNRSVDSWRAFKAYVDLLHKDRSKYKTIICDTVDNAYLYCFRAVCEQQGVSHPSEGTHGKVWSAVADEWHFVLNRLLKCGRGVVFLSHATEKTLKRLDGSEDEKIVPTIKGQAREILEAVVDIWAYYTYASNGARIMRIRGDAYVSAGHRLEHHFHGVETIPMGNSTKEGFRNFMAAFNKSAPVAAGAHSEKGGNAPNKTGESARTIVRKVVVK